MTSHMALPDEWHIGHPNLHLLFLQFYVAVTGAHSDAVIGGRVGLFNRNPKTQIKSSFSEKKAVCEFSRPVHPRIRQSCGFMSESYLALIYRTGIRGCK